MRVARSFMNGEKLVANRGGMTNARQVAAALASVHSKEEDGSQLSCVLVI
jgi:hypothetical protein